MTVGYDISFAFGRTKWWRWWMRIVGIQVVRAGAVDELSGKGVGLNTWLVSGQLRNCAISKLMGSFLAVKVRLVISGLQGPLTAAKTHCEAFRHTDQSSYINKSACHYSSGSQISPMVVLACLSTAQRYQGSRRTLQGHCQTPNDDSTRTQGKKHSESRAGKGRRRQPDCKSRGR